MIDFLKQKQFVLCVIVFFTCPFVLSYQVDDSVLSEKKEGNLKTQKTISPYCGIQAVCLAARGFGKNADVIDMAIPRYLGSRKGRSLYDLRILCHDIGLYSSEFRRLTIWSLYYSPRPLILHTTFRPGSGLYDHWTLFTGMENNRAKIWKVIDGKGTYELMDIQELASRWDGIALMVSDKREMIVVYFLASWIEYLLVIIVPVFGIFIFLPTNKKHESSIKQGKFWTIICGLGKISFISLLLLFGYKLVFQGSFLSNNTAVQKIQEQKFISFFPKIVPDKIRASKNENLRIVDTRIFSKYEDHLLIPNSVNISYQISEEETASILKDIPKDTLLVIVYSPFSCDRAVDVFLRLWKLGYHRMCRFENGWEYLKEHNVDK